MHALRLANSPDDVIDGNVQKPPVQRGYLHAASRQGFTQQHPGGEDQIVAVPLEPRMRLVADNEDDVGRDIVGSLITLLGEGDASALSPAALNCNGQDLVPNAGGVAVFIHHLTKHGNNS